MREKFNILRKNIHPWPDIMYFVISLSRLFQLDIRTILKQQNTNFGTYPIAHIITDLCDMVDSLISNLRLIGDLRVM